MLAFIDESYQLVEKEQKVYLTTYAAVMVRQHASRNFARDLFALKKKLWNQADPFDKELKGRLLLCERKSAENERFVFDLLEMAKSHGFKFFAVTTRGPLGTLKSAHLRLPKLFQFLLERVNNYTALVANECFAAPIFDSVEDKTNKLIASGTTNFLFRHGVGQTFAHILDFPIFGDSATTPGIQVADIVAYTVNNWRTGQRQDLDNLYAEMRSMTHDWKNPVGSTDWGFRYMKEAAQ